MIVITSASVGKGGGAYAYSGINSFFDRNMTYEVFVHEAAHIFDNDYKSKTPDWYNAITADSCVPDDYSKASKTEVSTTKQLTDQLLPFNQSIHPISLPHSSRMLLVLTLRTMPK